MRASRSLRPKVGTQLLPRDAYSGLNLDSHFGRDSADPLGLVDGHLGAADTLSELRFGAGNRNGADEKIMSVHAHFLKPKFLYVKNYSFRDGVDNCGYCEAMTLGQKIRARREEMNLSQADIAKRIGISQVAIDKIESGKTLKSRYLPEVLSILGMPLDLISSTVERGSTPTSSTVSPVDLGELVPVKIAGKAKAGEFIAIEDLGDWEEPETFLDTRDPRFPHARHLGFEVEGDSMNALKPRAIQDGDRLSALAYEDIADRYPLRDGMIVIVERTRHGGHEREWSVKQLEIYEDRMEFHPRSSNPRHKPIIIKRDSLADDGVTVEIIAIVRRLVAEFNL